MNEDVKKSNLGSLCRKSFDEIVEELALSDSTHSRNYLRLFVPELWECGLALFDQVGMMDEHPSYERMLYVSQLLPQLLKSIDGEKEDVLVDVGSKL